MVPIIKAENTARLTLRDCAVVRNGDTILTIPDLSFDSSGLVVIVGRNGAGKTTLLNHVRRPELADRVFFQQQDVYTLAGRAAARLMASLPQFWPADIDMSVRSFVLFGAYPWLRHPGRPEMDAAEQCLADTDMAALADRSMATLSGGERQRAALAAILMQDAPLWLLDEPFSALDLPGELALWELVQQIAHERKKLVLICAHGLNLALRHADRVLALHQGALIFDGLPQSLPEHPAARSLTGERFVWRNDNGSPMVVPR